MKKEVTRSAKKVFLMEENQELRGRMMRMLAGEEFRRRERIVDMFLCLFFGLLIGGIVTLMPCIIIGEMFDLYPVQILRTTALIWFVANVVIIFCLPELIKLYFEKKYEKFPKK